MVYRCDFQNYLVHLIDYLTRDELVNCQYAVISAKIHNNGRSANCIMMNNLFYPDIDAIEAYATTGDKEIFRKLYINMAKGEKDERRLNPKYADWFVSDVYRTFIKPFVKDHYNVMIICDRSENYYIDVLCDILKDFDIEVIDLNKLFKYGRIGPIYIDRDKIWDNAVDIHRAAVKEEDDSMNSTRDGIEASISKMKTRDKVAKLKSFGIKVNKNDLKNIDELLLEAWCDDKGLL